MQYDRELQHEQLRKIAAVFAAERCVLEAAKLVHKKVTSYRNPASVMRLKKAVEVLVAAEAE